MKLTRTLCLLMFAIVALHVTAQERIPPAPVQDSTIILMNGRAHIGNGQVIENSAIGFSKGKITFVADATTIRINPKEVRIIDVSGKDVYPGLIVPNSDLGLWEFELVRATNDKVEVGSFNPAVRSITSYNTDSRVTPTVRNNGVLLAQIVPSGSVVSGTSSVVQLDAWNWEDAEYKPDDGIWMTWPFYNPFKPEQQEQYKLQVANIESFFAQSRAYGSTKAFEPNVQFEAMRGLWNGKQKLFIRASTSYQITAAVLFAKHMGLTCVIVGGEEAYKTIDVLKQNNVAVVLNRSQSLPLLPDDDVDQPYKNAAALQQAGILYSLSMDIFWQNRNQPFNAGQTVAYGVDKEQALASVTFNAAKILGIDKQTGTLETGKDANIVVSTGDILDMRTNNVEYAFIQGRQISLDDKQKQLFEVYRNKYNLK